MTAMRTEPTDPLSQFFHVWERRPDGAIRQTGQVVSRVSIDRGLNGRGWTFARYYRVAPGRLVLLWSSSQDAIELYEEAEWEWRKEVAQ